MNKDNYLVCVRCTTYNHASYIEEAMNGFVIQQTTFPFICVIIDDASTDGTTAVINNFFQENFDISDKASARFEETDDYKLYFACHLTNKNCFFLVLSLKYNHYLKKDKNQYVEKWLKSSKYLAMCEGDDYWTDPQKLQVQADVMESDPSITMCFHAVNYISNGQIIRNDRREDTEREYSAPEIIRQGGDFCATCSFFYKSEYHFEMPKFRQMSLASGVGDWPLQVLLALRGKIHYFPQIMGCYRVGNSTSWSGTSLSDTKRLFKHWNNMIAWYKELDNYTTGAYHHDVYHLITRLSLTIYSNKQYPRKELLYNIRQLNWGKTRLLYYMKLAAIDFPVLARIAHSLNLYYPSNN